MLEALERMAGSPTLARVIEDSLNRLADGVAGPELAELAKETLAGRITLGSAGRSDTYGRFLTQAVKDFNSWYKQLTEDERQRVVEEARAKIR